MYFLIFFKRKRKPQPERPLRPKGVRSRLRAFLPNACETAKSQIHFRPRHKQHLTKNKQMKISDI